MSAARPAEAGQASDDAGLVVEGVEAVLGGRAVLRGVDLVARPGEVLVVVGPNGAGKSTLLRLVAGLRRPDTGRVLVGGDEVSTMPARARARRIGLVPQEAHLDLPFTVREVVAMGRFAHRGRFGGPSPADHEAVTRALAEARLTGLADRAVTRLSGGERRRVLLGRTLAQDPEVLLLDEPTSNLDLGQVWRVHRTMRRAAAAGRTVVAVVHDLEAAAALGDRLALLAEGRVVATGLPQEVLTAAHVSKAFGVHAEVAWDADDAVHVRVVDEATDGPH